MCTACDIILFFFFLIAGSFPLTENESENVLAMATDTTEKHLLAGDTQGFVSVFFIQDYCNSDQVVVVLHATLSCWFTSVLL